MKINVITGLPRSGSTLFCNLLNQNKDFWATSTSPLPFVLNTISQSWSNSIEIKNLLEKKQKETEKRMLVSMKSFIEGWYQKEDKKVIFDKSRGWNVNSLLFKKIYPNGKIICLIRDLRNVFASIKKNHRKNPLVDIIGEPILKTIYNRADKMFSNDGLIGNCIMGIEDLIRRNPDNLIFIQYETFVSNPKLVMERIYNELEEDYFEHNFENVKNTAIDCDGHYLNKYPHKGQGKISPSNSDEWKKYISQDLANIIMQRFKDYNNFFGYK